MKLKLKLPEKSINKAFRKNKVNRIDFENFKTHLQIIIDKIDNNESEEHLKNYTIQFLKNTFYKNNEVNTKGRTDLAIYNGIDNKSTVGVIFETKKPLNKADMITKEDINKKALHEIILYYIQERIEHENNEIKNIIITNLNEWFIFDAIDFEHVFYHNGECSVVKEYKKWKIGQKTSKNTDLFYNEIAKKYIKQNELEIECTYINFEKYKNFEDISENKLINLYKLFSPEHLLKLPNENDSNSLNTGFYNELLYIIGLEETQINNKKIIVRQKQANRNSASLIENTINILKTEDRLNHISDIEKRYGTKSDEQIINVALELNIMWINRILFLKLLEAQLIQYHNNNNDYSFFNLKNILYYDQLNELFFEVLAKKPNDRNQSVKEKYKHIPYLNSSLFEISKLEDETIRINSLKTQLKIQKYKKSILKHDKNFTIIEYILQFLDAYDFTSEGSGKIQEENKNLINASVLGLIFEKINGYKDGSFFTPGYVTMYMSNKNIRNAIVQKFKDTNLPDFKKLNSFKELKDKIENRKQANQIVNSLKICDPAVGSGHFLVSALNEIIAIKAELGILEYKNGNRIKNYKIEVINDELIISDKDTDELFEYSLNKNNKAIDYKQDLQEALFYEKQTIIENCLFGVDINPNSVNICRLRLWIELLKNSYYTRKSNYKQIETLPNIDINIKQGNSLVGRFGINGNGLTNGNAQKMKIATEKYKTQVILYKSTNDKIVKQKAEKEIIRIKQQFAQNVNPTDKDYILLQQKKAKLGEMPMFFSEKEKEQWKKQTETLTKKVIELEKTYKNKLKTLYGNAFEWRFEFPEVLDVNGNFVGFDIIIGNPPYIDIRSIEPNLKNYFNNTFIEQKNNFDLYSLFIEKGFALLKKNGHISYIVPKPILYNSTFSAIRKQIFNKNVLFIKLFNKLVFKEASVENIVFSINNSNIENNNFIIKKNNKTLYLQNSKDLKQGKPVIIANTMELEIINKIKNHTKLFNLIDIIRGLELGKKTLKRYTEKTKQRIALFAGEAVNKYSFNTKKMFYVNKKQLEKYLKDVKSDFIDYPRILLRRVANKPIATIINKGDNLINNLNSVYNISINSTSNLNNKVLLAILNSKLASFYIQKIFSSDEKIFPYIRIEQIKQLPINIPSNIQQKVITDKVEIILAAKINNINADTIKLENEIDQLVYKLYNLSNNEIEIIENATT